MIRIFSIGKNFDLFIILTATNIGNSFLKKQAETIFFISYD